MAWRPCPHCGSISRPGASHCPVCGPHAHGRPPDHLTPTVSSRGFKHLPPISVMLGSESVAEALGAGRLQGGDVQVYESSNADGPHIWLTVQETGQTRSDGRAAEATIQLDAAQARQLSEQIEYLLRHHYQTADP